MKKLFLILYSHTMLFSMQSVDSLRNLSFSVCMKNNLFPLQESFFEVIRQIACPVVPSITKNNCIDPELLMIQYMLTICEFFKGHQSQLKKYALSHFNKKSSSLVRGLETDGLTVNMGFCKLT